VFVVFIKKKIYIINNIIQTTTNVAQGEDIESLRAQGSGKGERDRRPGEKN
jgi:hypothetical protein